MIASLVDLDLTGAQRAEAWKIAALAGGAVLATVSLCASFPPARLWSRRFVLFGVLLRVVWPSVFLLPVAVVLRRPAAPEVWAAFAANFPRGA